MLDYKKELEKAVQHFWRTRGSQKKRQGGNRELRMPVTAARSPVANTLMGLFGSLR
jgi:hypothetical protein